MTSRMMLRVRFNNSVARGVLRWFCLLFIWALIVLRELPESGEAYMIEKIPPFLVGVTALVMGTLTPFYWSDIGVGWQVSIFLGGLLVYLLAGAFAFFAAGGTRLGPWYEYENGW